MSEMSGVKPTAVTLGFKSPHMLSLTLLYLKCSVQAARHTEDLRAQKTKKTTFFFMEVSWSYVTLS